MEDLRWRFAVLDLWVNGHRSRRPVAKVAVRHGKSYQAAMKWIRRFDGIAALENNGSVSTEVSNRELVQSREKSISIRCI